MEHKMPMKNLAIAYAMKRKAKKMSHESGMTEGEDMSHEDGGSKYDDLVDRIMNKRKMMSEGGQVANDTDMEADFMPNDFDDLALRDDLHSTYGEDDNSGDALGNTQEDHDRSDIIARIMKSRAKKDRMPSPA